MAGRKIPPRKDGRVIIHFDYDCFYAAVFECQNPALRNLPLAVQQKQIIVTCNYEARRRGLHKLQLIRDARRICPEVIIELGEDISRFRDASKELYAFLHGFSWNGLVERLGFDEVWMDVTDLVEYNLDSVNRHDLAHSFFQLDREDPMKGFEFDASGFAGGVFAKYEEPTGAEMSDLTLRLRLGSHLAMYLRLQLEEHKGYTSTVGIATNKMLAKVVGNVNKPSGQTTLVPPLDSFDGSDSNVSAFLDDHEIGRIPGIGFKLAQKLREFVLQRPAEFDPGLVYGGTKEKVTVAAVRNNPQVNPEMLETLLGGPGSPHGIGFKVWCLLHGIDESEVCQARPVPRQISIEDSYIRLDTMAEVLSQLNTLAKSLITRMRVDLLGDEDDFDPVKDSPLRSGSENSPTLDTTKRWLAHPKTLRLTTRPRLPLQADGTRLRSFKRISHSAPLPNFVFSLHDGIDALAERLVREALTPMFRKLHPERAGWNLSLVNLAVTNMAEAAGASKTASGRDIGSMFRRQEDVLKDFRVVDVDGQDPIESEELDEKPWSGAAVSPLREGDDGEEGWIDEDGNDEEKEFCEACHSHIPAFAIVAHRRYHSDATTT